VTTRKTKNNNETDDIRETTFNETKARLRSPFMPSGQKTNRADATGPATCMRRTLRPGSGRLLCHPTRKRIGPMLQVQRHVCGVHLGPAQVAFYAIRPENESDRCYRSSDMYAAYTEQTNWQTTSCKQQCTYHTSL